MRRLRGQGRGPNARRPRTPPTVRRCDPVVPRRRNPVRALGALLALLSAFVPRPAGAQAASDDHLSKVAERMRAADYAGALRTLRKLPRAQRERPDARYVRARAQAALGDYATAADSLPTAAHELPAAVRDGARTLRARLLARAGRFEEALITARTLADEGVERAQMRALVGECALALGRADEAAAAFDALTPRDLRALDELATALLHAEALLASGQVEASARRLQTALDRAPGDALASVAQQRLSELANALPKPTQATPSFEALLSRAETLTRAGQADEAVALLAELRTPALRRARAELFHVRGMALFRTRNRYPEAARWLRRAAQLGGPSADSDAFHAARALSRADRDREAVRGYAAFVRRFPKSPYAAQAAYLGAWLSLRHGFAGGPRAMWRFIDGPYAKRAPRSRRRGLFELAMHAFVNKRFAEAQRLFTRYAESSAAAMVAARGRYWAGRSDQLRGQRKQAAHAFVAALAVEPLHYYGQLARLRLIELGEPVPPVFQAGAGAGGPTRTAESPPVTSALPAGGAAAFYARIGLERDAAVALMAEERAVTDAAPKGQGLHALVRLYNALGATVRPHQLVMRRDRSLTQRPPLGADRLLWQAAFARPFPDEVARLSERYGVDADLVYAVVRKESNFDPNVVSHANAIGLMQLIPPTAAHYAEREGLAFEPAQLFDPAYNLQLGSAYLKELLREFDGHAALAIAAYNAGEHQVHAWLKRERHGKQPLSLDWFVERIPIQQTHNYVRRVLGNWARYRYLAATADATDGTLVDMEAEAWPPLALTL